MRALPQWQRPPTYANVDAKLEWCITQIQAIIANSQTEDSAVADPFTITNPTPLRTLNTGTATLAQVAQALGTFIQDFQKRGLNRGNG